MLQSICYFNIKTADCNIFKALVLDAWRTDVYRAEGQNWPFLQHLICLVGLIFLYVITYLYMLTSLSGFMS